MDARSIFSGKVQAYAQARPAYPPALISLIQRLAPGPVGADIGAGTGIFSEQLARAGFKVQAVEPNREMRELISADVEVHDGSAEATGLPDASVDFITCAQSFHWFRPEETRQEFIRILKPHGLVFLFWNKRSESDAPQFKGELDALFESYGSEAAHVNRADEEVFRSFFSRSEHEEFPLETRLSLREFEQLGFSRSYMPLEGDPRRLTAQAQMAELFARHAKEGTIRVPYVCKVTFGTIV